MARRNKSRGRNSSSSLGGLAFLIGIVLAVVLAALGTLTPTWTLIIVIIGLIVGALNVSESESSGFMMAGVVLIIASAFGGSAVSAVSLLSDIFDALLLIFVPATIVVAIREAYSAARR